MKQTNENQECVNWSHNTFYDPDFILRAKSFFFNDMQKYGYLIKASLFPYKMWLKLSYIIKYAVIGGYI